MSLDDRTAQEKLTPEERRALLRAFADRMLLKVTNMDDPEDLPGVERAVRVAAVIERLYSRCDRAERQAPDPRKLQAERASHESEAIKAHAELASTLEWSEKRRRTLGQWWDAAQNATKKTAPEHPARACDEKPETPANKAKVTYVDYTDDIEQARAELALRKRAASLFAESAKKPPPPS